MDDVGGVGWVRSEQLLQDLDLALGLLQEPLLVPDYLESGVLLGLVVIHLEDLSEGSLAEHPEHLVPVGHVVVAHVDVATLRVVVSLNEVNF